MLIVLIVVPCVVVGVALVALLDRGGLLPHLSDGGGRPSRAWGSGSSVGDTIPPAALLGAMVVMGLWIIAWIVALVIGLGILTG